VTKVLDRKRKEGFILAQGFRGFSPWLLGHMHLGRTSLQWKHMTGEFLHLMVARKQRVRKGSGTRYNLYRLMTNDLLSPPRPYLLSFQNFLK
jgi:hypothetical protein